VAASWAVSPTDDPFDTSLEVECKDRDGLLLDLATIMSAMKVGLSEINCRTMENGRAIASLTFRVRDVGELNTICARIRTVSGVEQVRRGKS
jgi:GTP pyrophosphokinase